MTSKESARMNRNFEMLLVSEARYLLVNEWGRCFRHTVHKLAVNEFTKELSKRKASIAGRENIQISVKLTSFDRVLLVPLSNS
jgi:hypothetical protein